ncbi:hypothetical protein [Streptomyces sp. NPDC088775]|uniref:hypothetical protein n=1 Tax=Streptomyces sp. NPDC088775 TaxID=3365896 RepID=UPI0038101E5D
MHRLSGRLCFQGERAGREFGCPGVPLPHGFKREHIVYPTWGTDRSCANWNCEEPDPTHLHGPEPYCDDINCPCMTHTRDCDVCEGGILAPGLNVLRDNHEDGDERLSRRDKLG